MSPNRKAAIFLLSLDAALASQVLGHLSREQVEAATLAIAETKGVTLEEQTKVLDDFQTQFRSQPQLRQGGPEAARELLQQTLGDEADLMRDRIEQKLECNPFAFLFDRPAEDVRALLNTESTQVIAVVAAHLPSALSAAVLAGFAPDRQADILQRIARLGPLNETILNEIASYLRERLPAPPVRKGGVSRAASVLRATPRNSARSAMASLDQLNDDLADELRLEVFSFDDVLSLDDDTLRTILAETDDRQWALALKASPESVRQKVFGCLSPHVAQALKNEMQSLGPVRLSEMTAVRQQIAETIHRLDEAGVIDLPLRMR